MYRQRNSEAAVLRVVKFELPDPKKLSIPDVVLDLADQKKGMILISGPAGSGKSTTLACIIDRINQLEMHILLRLKIQSNIFILIKNQLLASVRYIMIPKGIFQRYVQLCERLQR